MVQVPDDALSRELSSEPVRHVDKWMLSASARGLTSIANTTCLRQVFIPPRPPLPHLGISLVAEVKCPGSMVASTPSLSPTFHASKSPVGSAFKINPSCGSPATQSGPGSSQPISLLDISPPPSLPRCLSPHGPQESPFLQSPYCTLLHLTGIPSQTPPPQRNLPGLPLLK